MTKKQNKEDYVQLYRGGKYMKKSSAKYFAKKNAEREKTILVWSGVAVVVALILSQCS